MQYALLVCGIGAFLAVLFFLPETSHPNTRGIDKLRLKSSKDGERKMGRWGTWMWVNPMTSLGLLKSPNLLAVVSVFYLILRRTTLMM